MEEHKETLSQIKVFLEQHKNPINANALATMEVFMKQVYDSNRDIFNRLYRLEQSLDIDKFKQTDNLIMFISSIFSFVKFMEKSEYINFTNQISNNMIECEGNYQIIFNDCPRKLMFDVYDNITDKELVDICDYTELALSKKDNFMFTTDDIYITHDKGNGVYHITTHDKKMVSYYEQLAYVECIKAYINNINKLLIKKIIPTPIQITKNYKFIKHNVSDDIIIIKNSKLVRKNYLQCFNILHGTEYYDVQNKENKFEIVVKDDKWDLRKITIEYIEKIPPTKMDPTNKYIETYGKYVLEKYPGLKPYGKYHMSPLFIELGFINGKNQKFTYWHKQDITHKSEIAEPKILNDNTNEQKKRSAGENLVANILDELNIKYEEQKTFPNLKYKKSLRLDFYFEHNKKKFAIEFDGGQHHSATKFFGGEEAFKLTQLRDTIKDDYCITNNIIMIRVSENSPIKDIIVERINMK